jgi:predicted alpha/beta superfamily hydrolase
MKYLLFILIIFDSFALSATDYSIDTVTMRSESLHEDRRILVFRPDGLQKADSVSVIYLLDGESSKYRYEHILAEQPARLIIGVGIDNTDRRRDMLPVGQPGNFLDFIAFELIPEIESLYNVDQRILYGHSFAGGFTIFAMINKPGLFDRYIASSPVAVQKLIDPEIYQQLDRGGASIRFYFGYGSRDMKQVRKCSEKLNLNLSGLNLEHIHWKSNKYEGKDHNTSALQSLLEGLKYP